MTGIIYKYTAPNGKVYIGQTTKERNRRNTFLNENKNYAGIKIDNARRKYGAINFKYEILETVYAKTNDELLQQLNTLETYYIGLYNSFKNGYNMSIGGQGSIGYNLTEEHKQKIRQFLLTKNPFKGKKHTQKTKDIISSKNSIPVLQIDMITGKIINRFKSATAAAMFLGKKRGNCQITKVCKKYVQPSDGKKYLSAYGYKWEYDIEGSTTIETTLDIDNSDGKE